MSPWRCGWARWLTHTGTIIGTHLVGGRESSTMYRSCSSVSPLLTLNAFSSRFWGGCPAINLGVQALNLFYFRKHWRIVLHSVSCEGLLYCTLAVIGFEIHVWKRLQSPASRRAHKRSLLVIWTGLQTCRAGCGWHSGTVLSRVNFWRNYFFLILWDYFSYFF